MDEGIDRALPPFGFALAIGAEPAVVRSPVARLVLLDDPEDLHKARVPTDDRMVEQDLYLLVAALLRQRDHAAELFEEPVFSDHAGGIEPIDGRAEHDFDEAVDVAARPVNEQRHFAAFLEPPPEHQIMLSLVRAVLFN